MRNIIRIIKIARPLWGLLALVSSLIVCGALVDLVTPLLFKQAVDEITRIQSSAVRATIPSTIITIMGAMLVINIVGQAISNVSSRLGDHFAGKLRRYLTNRYYEKALTLSQSYYDGELSGKIINELNRGVQVISDFFNTATNFIGPSFLQAVFTIVLLAYFDIPTALCILLLFPLYIVLTALSTKKWSLYQAKRNTVEDRVRGRLSESIQNIRLVRGFNNQSRELQAVSQGLQESNTWYAKQSGTFHLYDFARNTGLHGILFVVFLLSFIRTYQGQSSLGELILIIQLVNQIRRPLFAMSFVLGRIQEAETGSKEYFHVFDLPSREPLDSISSVRSVPTHSLVFDDVSFAYEQDRTILHHVSFTIDRDQVVALVGKSGAGKTTITNLIMKFYDPTGGDISMGGLSYRQLSATDVRHHIALVFQDHELFSTSVRENVAYGQDADDHAIEDALAKAQALDFVRGLPRGLDSEIGERGVKLSGGQKQRIQIARAILRDAPILILDEATSSLDAQSESEVQRALEVLMRDRIVLVIAHRFSTIRNADRIIVLDEGAIIDQGAPTELATHAGIYQDLLRFQIEGNQKLLDTFELH